MRTKVHDDVGWSRIVTTDGWSSLGHPLLQYRWIIMGILSLDKHINEVRFVTAVLLYPAFTWFYIEKKQDQVICEIKLVGDLIYDCSFWYICKGTDNVYTISQELCWNFEMSTFWFVGVSVCRHFFTNNPANFAVYGHFVLCWVVVLFSSNYRNLPISSRNA